MRYLLLLISFLFIGHISAQVEAKQIEVDTPYSELKVMVGDTTPDSDTYGLAMWMDADSLAAAFRDYDWLKGSTSLIPGNADTARRTGVTWLYDNPLLFSRATGGTFAKILPIQTGVYTSDWQFAITNHDNAGSARDNHVLTMGWNLDGSGGLTKPGLSSIGLSFEDHYEPSAGDSTSEYHTFFIDSVGNQSRLQSYTIDKADPSLWEMYNTIRKYYIKDPTNGGTFFATQRSGTDGGQLYLLGSAAGTGVEMATSSTNTYLVIQPSGFAGNGKALLLNSWNIAYLPGLTSNNIGGTKSNVFNGLTQTFADFPSSLNSAGDPVNVLNTDASGNLRSDPVSFFQDLDWIKEGTASTIPANAENMFHMGEVGIGTITPGYKLDVTGQQRILDQQRPLLLDNTGYALINFRNDAGANKWDIGKGSVEEFYIADATTAQTILSSQSGSNFINVHGTMTPATGSATASVIGMFRATNPGTAYGQNLYLNMFRWTDDASCTALCAKTGVTFRLADDTGITPDTDVLTLLSSGNVGIGTLAPSKTLHVAGTARITGSDGTATAPMGRDADGDVSAMTEGWGINYTGGAIVVDSAQIATQYDLTLIDGGDDWGSDVVNTDITLTGDGTSGDELKVDTSIMATQYDLNGVKWIIDGDDADTELVSNQTIKFEGDYGIVTDYDATGNILNIEADTSQLATQYDLTLAVGGSFMHWFLRGEDTAGHQEITDADTVTILDGGITSVTRTNDTIIITSTEVDGSVTNEIQDLENASDGTTHTVTISDGDGSLQLAEGTGITLTTTGDAVDGIVTIATTALLSEVDGDISNELQTISNTSDATSHTQTLSDAGGSTQYIEGTGITLTTGGTEAAGTVTIASTIVDTDTYTTVKVDNAAVSTDAPTLDYSSTDFGVAESPTDEFQITIQAERIQDLAGAMFSSNTETGGTITYQDADGTIDFVADDASATNELNTIEEGNVSVQTGNSTLDFQALFDVVTDGAGEVNVSLDLSEATTVTTPEADDYMIMHDAGLAQHQKILWSDLYDLVTDGLGGDHDWYEEGTTDPPNAITDNIFTQATEVGIGTTTPDYQLDIESNTVNVMINDLNGGSGNQVMLRTSVAATGTGTFGGISYQYVDASAVDAWDIEGNRRVNDQANSTFEIRANEGTDAVMVIAEKNENLSDNTTESHLAFNGGIAHTQNYEWTATSADLTLDRSYNIVNVSGAGAVGDEINLPEAASTADNWDAALTSAQVQVGQEYTVSNFRAATNLVVRVFTGDQINNAASTLTVAPGDSYIIKLVRFASGVGYWKTY